MIEFDAKAAFLAAMIIINAFGIPVSIWFMLNNVETNDAMLAVTSLLIAMIFALNVLAISIGITYDNK